MAKKYDHITPILARLHWLPIAERIQFKFLLLFYKSLQGLAPPYLSELVNWYIPARSLRSCSNFLAEVKSVKQTKSDGKNSKVLFKDRAFENLGPKLFNTLPDHIRSSQSLPLFKSRLKTYLFTKSFNS